MTVLPLIATHVRLSGRAGHRTWTGPRGSALACGFSGCEQTPPLSEQREVLLLSISVPSLLFLQGGGGEGARVQGLFPSLAGLGWKKNVEKGRACTRAAKTCGTLDFCSKKHENFVPIGFQGEKMSFCSEISGPVGCPKWPWLGRFLFYLFRQG